jgi:PBP1b-binding outer membrane lipoprotein LpoB
MKNINKYIIILLSIFILNGCVTIICNSAKIEKTSEIFTDEATKNQAETIENDGGLL